MASSRVTNIQAALSQNIEQLLPVTFVWFPIRLKQSRILGGLVHWESYADIKGLHAFSARIVPAFENAGIVK